MALTPSQEIDKFINNLTDWRGKWIKQFRVLILKTAPEVSEDWSSVTCDGRFLRRIIC